MTAGAAPVAASDTSTSLVTCSFSGDYEICQLLCDSVDRFVAKDITHVVYVPARDVPLFSSMANDRRLIRSQESLLPRGVWNLPLPPPRWRTLLHLPRRNVYITPYSLPVRGWIAQQIMKIAATRDADTGIVVHVDSDNAFIRPLGEDAFVKDGRVRLFRDPHMVDMPSHRTWHRAAGTLLGLDGSGLEQPDFHGAEYIDQLVVWKRDVLLAMIERIETVAQCEWWKVLSRTPQFAEYILYGVFADKVCGLEKAGLFADKKSMCLSRWSGDMESDEDEAAFINLITPGHAACLIQSTIAMTLETRRRLFERATSFAAAQDQTA